MKRNRSCEKKVERVGFEGRMVQVEHGTEMGKKNGLWRVLSTVKMPKENVFVCKLMEQCLKT